MFQRAKWIWAKDNDRIDDRVVFRKTFVINEIRRSEILRIAAETKYYLWINGVLTVFDGGLYRESSPGNGYYDEIDMAEKLRIGENVLEFLVWFYGNGGRNNNALTHAGLLFEMPDTDLYSDGSTLACRHPAYYPTGKENPSYLYGGHNIGYDARKSLDSDKFCAAVEYGAYPCAPWNLAEKRPIPQFYFTKRIEAAYKKEGGRYTVVLPYALHGTPWFSIKATGGEIIDIRSDRYVVNGGPGDSENRYRGHRTEYICKKGAQEFESLDWIFGESLIFTIPDTVEIVSLGYRESGYPTKIRSIQTKDRRLNILLEKCARTLVCCMRDNFMDCPDRERGQWIGDVSVQAPQVFCALDENAALLLKKAILDFIRLKKGDRLVGNVPGENFAELPAQSLHAIGQYGMIAEYYRHTKDREILETAFLPCVKYLLLFEMAQDGLVAARKGDWEWYDHLYNIDHAVIRNAWYYSALDFALYMASELKASLDIGELQRRKSSIAANFNAKFWQGKYYASGTYADDRANALAVLAGLAEREKYNKITEILSSVFNASAYMEGFVLEALCLMDKKQLAYKRMMSRYAGLIDNENSTLWEDFYILGTKNHAWTGSPLTIVSKYFPEL